MPALNKATLFPARLGELRVLRRFVESFFSGAGLAHDDCLRVNLVLEELFTNTVKHGYQGECDAPIWIDLREAHGTLHVTYEDSAPPFNPYVGLPEFEPEATLRSRRIGGLGVLLTRKLANTRDYAYLYGRNRIRLEFLPG
ncbi:MAG TPA: ATP-binding protein [Burkholderiales bacterium]|nr:ATP-binding protein [Burkholderiales bacterium]